jgi:hypothetical protein
VTLTGFSPISINVTRIIRQKIEAAQENIAVRILKGNRHMINAGLAVPGERPRPDRSPGYQNPHFSGIAEAALASPAATRIRICETRVTHGAEFLVSGLTQYRSPDQFDLPWQEEEGTLQTRDELTRINH